MLKAYVYSSHYNYGHDNNENESQNTILYKLGINYTTKQKFEQLTRNEKAYGYGEYQNSI